MSSSRANQALRSLANAGFQNRGVCLQAFPSFPSPSPLFNFLPLVSFLARPKPRISFLGLSLLRNSTETLATQAIQGANLSLIKRSKMRQKESTARMRRCFSALSRRRRRLCDPLPQYDFIMSAVTLLY